MFYHRIDIKNEECDKCSYRKKDENFCGVCMKRIMEEAGMANKSAEENINVET